MSSSQQRQQRAAFNRIYEHNTKSHHNIWTHLLTQNPNTESFPLRDKTQTETCSSLAKDQIEYFFKRCAGMYCTCNGSNLSLFLAGVGFGYITLWLCSTLVSFNFRFIRIHLWTKDLHNVRQTSYLPVSCHWCGSSPFPELVVEASDCLRESALCSSIC